MRIISSSNLRCEVVAETAEVITNKEKPVIEMRKIDLILPAKFCLR